MRKVCFTFGMILVLSQAVYSQAAILVLIFGDKVASEHFYFSLKAGANITDISNIEAQKKNIGFNFGLVANIKLSERWYLIPEFAPFSAKGNRDVPIMSTGDPELDTLLVNPDKTKRKLKYIDVPIILRYKVADRFYLGAGPQIAFLTSATDTYLSTPIDDNRLIYEKDIKSKLNSLDYGMVFDAMYSVSNLLGGKGLDFHLRYYWGMADILKDNSGSALNNHVFHITVSFPFIEDTNN